MKARITITGGKIFNTITRDIYVDTLDDGRCKRLVWTEPTIVKKGEELSFILIPETKEDEEFIYGKQINLQDTTDATVWEEEFLRTIKENDIDIASSGFMIGWFANAMMAQHDHNVKYNESVINKIREIFKENKYEKESVKLNRIFDLIF